MIGKSTPAFPRPVQSQLRPTSSGELRQSTGGAEINRRGSGSGPNAISLQSTPLNRQSGSRQQIPGSSSSLKSALPVRAPPQDLGCLSPGNLVSAAISARHSNPAGAGHQRAHTQSTDGSRTTKKAGIQRSSEDSAAVSRYGDDGSRLTGAVKRPAGGQNPTATDVDTPPKRQRTMETSLKEPRPETLEVARNIQASASAPGGDSLKPPEAPRSSGPQSPPPFLPNMRGEQESASEVIDLG